MKRVAMMILMMSGLAGTWAAAPSEAQKTFDAANQHYEKNEIDDAFAGYEGLASRGFGGPALYYNLGNAHFRRGERGRAVLWYERAARLAPRDADIRFNLSIARSHIKTDPDNLFRRAASYLTENELSWATAVLSALFFGLLGFWTLGKLKGDTWPAMAVLVSGLVLAGSSSWLGLRIYMNHQPQAIIVGPPGEVRNGPGTDYAVGFTVPEGSRVVILNKRPDWTQVGVPDQGLKGWMPTREVEPITSTVLS